jgi:hypothetical protein
MTRPRAPSHMFKHARMMGNECKGLIHHKQGGILNNSTLTRWEEGGQLSFNSTLNFKLVFGLVSTLYALLLLSLDSAQEVAPSNFVIPCNVL